jgi:hypothetical protein
VVPARALVPGQRLVGALHQTLSFDAYNKFIEDDFLGGARLDPATDGRPDARPDVREDAKILGNLVSDFDFSQPPRAPRAAAYPPGARAGFVTVIPGPPVTW